MDARLLEMWLRLSADGLRGSEDARRALRGLGESPLSQNALSGWIASWLPEAAPNGRVAPGDLSEFQTMLEQWWTMYGMVPRSRYDELLRKHGELTLRLQEAEETIGRLRRTLRSGDNAGAEDVLDGWARLTQQTLDAQAEWASTWLGDSGGDKKTPER